MSKKPPVKVKDPTTGKEVQLSPDKVWTLAPKGRKGEDRSLQES